MVNITTVGVRKATLHKKFGVKTTELTWRGKTFKNRKKRIKEYGSSALNAVLLLELL